MSSELEVHAGCQGCRDIRAVDLDPKSDMEATITAGTIACSRCGEPIDSIAIKRDGRVVEGFGAFYD